MSGQVERLSPLRKGMAKAHSHTDRKAGAPSGNLTQSNRTGSPCTDDGLVSPEVCKHDLLWKPALYRNGKVTIGVIGMNPNTGG